MDILNDEQREALNFDPFEVMGAERNAGAEQPQQPQAQQPAEFQQPASATPVAGQTAPAQQPVPASSTNTQPAGVPAQQPVNSVEAFMAAVRNGQQPPGLPQMPQGFQPVPQVQPAVQAPQPQQAPQQGQQPVDFSQDYAPRQVNVPPQLMSAIFGEDPNAAAQAMNHVVGTLYNSILAEVHKNLGVFQGEMRAMPGTMQQQMQQDRQRQELYGKFYGKHADLNNPQGRDMATRIALNAAATYQQMGVQVDVMSDEFIDYVAQNARAALGMNGTPVAPKAQPRPAQFSTGGATRAGGAPANPFMDAIGANFG